MWYPTENRGVNNQNLILDITDITSESGVPSEPVLLQQMKDYMRIEGIDIGDADSFDDELIEMMILAARRKVERFCGISLVYHTWQVYFRNDAGDFELPYGPIITPVVAFQDYSGNELNDYTLAGGRFKTVSSPTCGDMLIEYDAGYLTNHPPELKLAIMEMVYFWYENRGNDVWDTAKIPQAAYATMQEFKRPWTWLA